MKLRAMGGFTLVELVVAITIIGVCSATVLGALALISLRSAEVLVSQQATVIAQSYLEEVIAKDFNAQADSGLRRDFNDVMDYNTLPDALVRDQFGNPVAGLGDYRVQVAVAAVGFLSGPTNIPAAQSRRIIVTVTDPLNQDHIVTAFKFSP
jgi:MSHA pilin protein MshD